MHLAFTQGTLIDWMRPPEHLSLTTEEVHVWLLRLDEYAVHLEAFLQRLNPEELQRVERYYFQKDRVRFAITRGMTKSILGAYLNVSPKEVRFRYTTFGKPMLADPGPDDLRFNVSHSQDLALLAVTRQREVGVDIEYRRPEVATEDIARRFFSVAEVESLAKLSKDLQLAGFFKCWTRKEAYVKAVGEGLSFPLDRFSVSFHPFQLPALLDVCGSPQETDRWLFWDVSPNSQYAAALVAAGSNLCLSCFQAEEVL